MELTPTDQQTLLRICRRLSPDCRILFITGAGMSADSGLPTYRGIGGLYNREHTDEGVPIEDALSGEMLQNRPELCWKYLAQIGQAAMGSTFNPGHRVLAEMEDHFAHTCILTQNIDGYHRAAGSQNVIEIHGNMHSLLCTECPFEESLDTMDKVSIPPRCPECEAVLRPDVVLFGEMLPTEKVEQLHDELDAGFDAVFAIGTTAVFPYIMQPLMLAKELGWMTVEINPAESRISHVVDLRLPLRAAVALEAIWERVKD